MNKRLLPIAATVCGLTAGLLFLFFARNSAGSAASNEIFPGQPAERVSKAWAFEFIDTPKFFLEFTDRSLRLDPTGSTHVAYGGDHLYYAWQEQAQWRYVTVDPAPQVGSFASLDLDPDGYAHISYYDAANRDLKYAYQDASGWNIVTLDDGEVAALNTSLAVDQEGRAHISYMLQITDYAQQLKYAYQDQARWQVQILDDSTEIYGNSSLALDPQGYAHIGYTAAGLEHAYQDASGWHLETVVEDPGAMADVSLAVDGNGLPHIAYRNTPPFTHQFHLIYAAVDASGWYTQPVDMGEGEVGFGISLALDEAGLAHISYREWEGGLKYAVQETEGWEVEKIVPVSGLNPDTSLALDKAGNVLVFFDAGERAELKIARLLEAGWQIDRVDYMEIAGNYNSLALDSLHYPKVSYVDPKLGRLKYAARDSSGWRIQAVTSEGQVSGWSALALDSQDHPNVASNALFAAYIPPNWYLHSIPCDSTYDSLALDQQDAPHIICTKRYPISSPYAPWRVLLNHLFMAPSGWVTETVLEATNGHLHSTVFQDMSLAINTAGQPSFSFYEIYNMPTSGIGFLYYASRDGSDWKVQLVDSSDQFVGQYSSLTLDENGYAHISYYDASDHDLKYAYQMGTGWFSETVDLEGDVGQYSSLALDSAGYAHISYYDATLGNLKYAHQDGFDWVIETVDSQGNVGAHTSLALDAADNAYISYQDSDSGHGYLKLAYNPAPITGLSAWNSSPTSIDRQVEFTAAVNAGNNVLYRWDFGDGNPGTGSFAIHHYSRTGVYTATVTAWNGTSEVEAHSRVEVVEMKIYLPYLSRR